MNDPLSSAAHAAIDLTQLADDRVVALLAGGQHATMLQAMFGAAEYDELHRLARRATRKPARGATRVYLLPGIMGSKLGVAAKSGKHMVWLNPRAIAMGELLSLALPDTRRLQPLGVMLPGYLKLKLHLTVAGFDAVFHPFDWRKSVSHSGKSLLNRIAADCRSRRIKQVMLVGHSMGGLVARAALAHDKKKRIARIVQLGSPNFGSYALVQALRGAYPTVRKVAALDPLHSVDQLARHVFRTLPGLYEMLPAPAHTDDLDLLQLDAWPDDSLGPDATLLASAPRVRAQLAAASKHCYHIVGVGQETVTQLRKAAGGFEYGTTLDGDGTVPRALAEWAGASTWYANERHGNLTTNDSVCKAVIDLLKRGATRQLARNCPAVARTVQRWISDAQLRQAPGDQAGKVNWLELPLEERRKILEPAISPEFQRLASHRAKLV